MAGDITTVVRVKENEYLTADPGHTIVNAYLLTIVDDTLPEDLRIRADDIYSTEDGTLIDSDADILNAGELPDGL